MDNIKDLSEAVEAVEECVACNFVEMMVEAMPEPDSDSDEKCLTADGQAQSMLDSANKAFAQVHPNKEPLTMDDINKYYTTDNMSGVYLLGDQNGKTPKGEKIGYYTAILYLMPSDLSGIKGVNTCPSASAGCRKACLVTSGRGVMAGVNRARLARTLALLIDRDKFMRRLEYEVQRHIKSAERKEMIPAVRLNGTSDIPWESKPYQIDGKTIMSIFPDTTFYDYTKIIGRVTKKAANPDEHKNYHLTFSASEDNDEHIKRAVEVGANVAVPFDVIKNAKGMATKDSPSKELPTSYSVGGKDIPVVDGDEHDLRFVDPKHTSHIVGLSTKKFKRTADEPEKGKRDYVKGSQGFVRHTKGKIESRKVDMLKSLL